MPDEAASGRAAAAPPRAPRPAPGRTTGGSWCASARWAPAATSSTSRRSRWRPRARARLPARRRARLPRRRRRTTSGGTATGRSTRRDGHAGFQAARFFVVSVGAFLVHLALLELLVDARGRAEVAGPGDRDRGRDAAELPRATSSGASAGERRPRGAARRAGARPAASPVRPPARAQTAPPDARAARSGVRSSRAAGRRPTRTRSATRPTSTSRRRASPHRAPGPGDRRRACRRSSPSARKYPRLLPGRRSARARAAGRSRYFTTGTASRARRSARSRSTTRPGTVTEAWTGYQVAWTMARGYPGAFGRKVELAVGVDPADVAVRRRRSSTARRPLRLLHLDLLVLAGLRRLAWRSSTTRRSASRSRSSTRCWPTCWRACCGSACARAREPTRRGRCALLVPVDVAGDRRRLPARLPHRPERHELERDRRRLLGRDRRRQAGRTASRCTATSRRTTSTATPTARSTTRPTCRSSRRCRWSGRWDDLPAAHAAAIAFDLLTLLLLFLHRPADPRAGASASCWPTPGRLPVHALRR